MCVETEARKLIGDELLIRRRSGQVMVLAANERTLLEDFVRRSVVEDEVLTRHVEWLRQRLEQWPSLESWDEMRLDAVLRGGLSELSDDELLSLTLNPIALWSLSDAITETTPEAWLSDLVADGQRRMALAGVKFDPAEFRRRVSLSQDETQRRGPISFPPAMALETLSAATAVAVSRASQQWSVVVPVEQLQWSMSAGGAVDSTPLRIELEWTQSVGLQVYVSGCWRIGPGFQLVVDWLSATGELIARDEVRDSFNVLPTLKAVDDHAPQVGEWLRLTNRSTGAAGTWEASCAIEFQSDGVVRSH